MAWAGMPIIQCFRVNFLLCYTYTRMYVFGKWVELRRWLALKSPKGSKIRILKRGLQQACSSIDG